MYTNLVMLIVGVAGFIVCISISAHSLRFPNLMRNIALVFAWVALSGIAFPSPMNCFPKICCWRFWQPARKLWY